MTNHISGKVVVVTGAGSGFGKLIAQAASAAGARLVCADIDLAAAQAVADGLPGDAIAAAADVGRIDDMRAMVDAAVDRFGKVDVLVNNAGIMPLAYLADHAKALEAWNRCIDINFKGVLNGTVAVYDRMMAQGYGHIVNISSTYGEHPVVGSAVYGATKAAVNYFTNSLRQESRGKIKVTLVKPTGVPATGLGKTVVNIAGAAGIIGQNWAEYMETIGQFMSGTLPPAQADAESPGYAVLDPQHVADAVVHAIDQPLGVCLSDVVVRATGDYYIL